MEVNKNNLVDTIHKCANFVRDQILEGVFIIENFIGMEVSISVHNHHMYLLVDHTRKRVEIVPIHPNILTLNNFGFDEKQKQKIYEHVMSGSIIQAIEAKEKAKAEIEKELDILKSKL